MTEFSKYITPAIQDVARALVEQDRVLILTHENPDGDALGSALALGEGLESLGKRVRIYCQGVVPEMYSFLSGVDRIAPDPGLPEDWDAVVILDCHSLDRVGEAALVMADAPMLIVVDHHVVEGELPPLHVLDTKAAAAGELVFLILTAMDVELSPTMAVSLYTAISTDTGSFSFDNTTAAALQITAELVRLGAEPWSIFQRLHMRRSPERLRLLAMALESLEFHMGGRLGVMTVTREMMSETGTEPEDTDGFVEYPRSVQGVELAALFRENGNGKVKVSLRSGGHADAAALARSFGGGGHFQAAGFGVEERLDLLKKRFLETSVQYLPDAARDRVS
jgi:phosphoesterase RecJ-like protein